MASIIPGYNYDIFISYRQKDNKGDKWVSQFVEALKNELESTFKEEVSVYFDINPSDYLLESYDVDASLKAKLKCLVFIPILSRTYCDSKSFAWVHEFKAFVEDASKDHHGLKIKLPNGNVASRVLPVIIHELDSTDIKECESTLGGVLRGIEFIYKEAGIDKPLSPGDNEKKNLNNTTYRIQIIKVAHAIKEIIVGMKTEPAKVTIEEDQHKKVFKEVRAVNKRTDLKKPTRAGLIISIAIAVLVIITGIIAYPKVFKKDTIETLRSKGERISIAVMPFQNLTNDPIKWNVYQEIIQSRLTSYLTNFQEYLQVRQPESVKVVLSNDGLSNFASITPAFASQVSKKLNADVYVYGNIIQSSNTILLSAQLIDIKTKEIIKSFQIEGSSDEVNLLPKIDTLSRFIKDFLVISKLEKEKEQTGDAYFQVTTNSPEAYKYFIFGMDAPDYLESVEWFRKAISVDSNFVLPYIWAIQLYLNPTRRDNISTLDSAKKMCLKIYQKRDQVPLIQHYMIKSQYAKLYETQIEQNKYLNQILDIDDQQAIAYLMLGENYYDMQEWDLAISALRKGLEIYENWGVKHSAIPIFYQELFQAYYRTGRFREGRKALKKFNKDFPDDNIVNNWRAILAFKEGKLSRGNKYVERWLSIEKKRTTQEDEILVYLGRIYSYGGVTDKARECCYKLLKVQSASLHSINSLAWFLLDDDNTTTEALELAERALALYPEDPIALHRKGWALYKLGKYNEAFELMQKSWDIRKEIAIFNYELDLHIKAAKKAVEGQKN